MSSASPASVPTTTTREKSRWLTAALYLLPFVVLDGLLVSAWSRGEIPPGAGLLFLWFLAPWQVGIVLMPFRRGDYPGVYDPPPNPMAEPGQWRFDPPEVPFGFVFALALLVLAVLNAILVFSSGSKWTFAETLGLTVVWLGGGIAAGFLFRSRPWLEVDEVRRELVWHPDTWWDDPLTLPFFAIAAIRVSHTSRHYYPKIEWRTNKGRTKATKLPLSLTRDSVEAVVVRLRAAVGLPPLEVVTPPAPETVATAPAAEAPVAWYDSQRWWVRTGIAFFVLAGGPTWRSDATELAVWGVIASVLVGVFWWLSTPITDRLGRRERWFIWALVGLIAVWAVGRWVWDWPPLSKR